MGEVGPVRALGLPRQPLARHARGGDSLVLQVRLGHHDPGDPRVGRLVTRARECTACEGTGKFDRLPCSVCYGTGFVWWQDSYTDEGGECG